MADNIEKLLQDLGDDAEAVAISAFQKALGNVEGIAKSIAPVGHYGRSRSASGQFKAGRTGGDLRASLRAEYIGKRGNEAFATLSSSLAYALYQHDRELHHPGLYTGAPGERYAAKYFERAVTMTFDGKPDPLGRYKGPKRATFQEILEREARG